MDPAGKQEPAKPRPGKAKRPKSRKPNFRKPKGPRPFDPESKAANVSLQEHIKQGVEITEAGRRHHRKKLASQNARKKRITSLNRSFIEHKKNLKKGLTPEDNAKTTVLYDLKKQEIELLQAFNEGALTDEEAALHKLLEIGFLAKMVGGPAFHRAGLDDADREAIEKFSGECLEAFTKENGVGA